MNMGLDKLDYCIAGIDADLGRFTSNEDKEGLQNRIGESATKRRPVYR